MALDPTALTTLLQNTFSSATYPGIETFRQPYATTGSRWGRQKCFDPAVSDDEITNQLVLLAQEAKEEYLTLGQPATVTIADDMLIPPGYTNVVTMTLDKLKFMVLTHDVDGNQMICWGLQVA
jgi:hypothetical protein